MRLRRQRRRDRPLVVVAEEDERCLHHAGEVRALVERALTRRAVAEEHDRARALALQLLAPRKAGGVRDLRRDRNADRCDVVVGRVPPARGMPAPPAQDGLGRHSAQERDRRLAVAREDPVLVVERVHGARLHRFVIPVDRVRADAALAVIDDGTLVVGAQQHHRAVQLEKLLLAEAVDFAVLIEHPAKLVTPLRNLRHREEEGTTPRYGGSRARRRPRGRSPARSRATAAGSRGGRSAARAACGRSAERPS